MITMKECSFKNDGAETWVTGTYTKDVKTAKCDCGNEWKPLDCNDFKCKICESKK